MSHRAKRAPQALTADRRQARPTARFDAVAPPAGTAGTRETRADAGARRAHAAPHERLRSPSPFVDTEPGVGRCLRTVAMLAHPGREPTGARIVWSDRRRTAEGIGELRRHELAPRLRSLLGLQSDEDAEALLELDHEWLRYPRPEETADVAALLPADLHALRVTAPVLRTPRWRRLRISPPPAAP